MFRPLFCSAALAMLVSCASYASGQEKSLDERMRANAVKPRVVAQLCASELKVPGQIGIIGVKRRGGRAISIGGALTTYLGMSTAGQFMFQSLLGEIEEFAGAVVFPVTSEQQIFLPRKSYPGDWTDWSAPDRISDDPEIQFKLLSGKAIAQGRDRPVRVLARFKTMSYKEFSQEHAVISRSTRRSDWAACPLNPSLER